MVRPLPTPEHARQDDYNRRVPSQQQPRYDPTGYTSSGRSYPSAGSGGNAGVSGSGGRAQGREGSSSSSVSTHSFLSVSFSHLVITRELKNIAAFSNQITSPAYGPPRPHSPLPPVPSSSYQTMPSAPPRTPPPSFPSSSSSTQPLPPGTSCFATKDHEVFQLIDLSGLRNAAAIRESVFAKLQIEDDAFAACDVFRTKMKAGRPLGARLSDTELWDACQRGEECTLYVRVDQRAVSTPTWAPGVDSAASSTAEFNREDRSSTIPSEHRHFVPPPYPEVQAPSSYAASRRAPSISSPSDTSNPNHISPVRETGPLVGEFGEPRGCGQSWNWGSGGSSAGQRQSGGGGDGIGLSPPMERGREREWDVRQSHLPSPDDFGRAETRSSVSTVQQQHYSPQLKHQASSQSMIMLPTGPVRRLPAPQEANEPPSRQRTQTSPGSPMPPNPPSTSTWAVRPPQPPLPSPSIRPLPSAFVSQSSQPPYPPYHNLHVQGLQSTFQQNQPTPPMPPLSPVPPHQNGSHNPNFPESARTVNFAKSAGNLREHYKIAFESDIRPNVQYTSPAGGRVLYPPARPQPPRLPPLSYPSSHSSQSQQQRPPPPQPSQLSFPSSPAPFDPRVMRPSPSVQGSSHVPPLTPQRPTTASGAYPSLWQQQSQHPPPTRRSPSDSADSSSHYSIPASMRVGGATAGQRWPNPHPDTTGSISLLPGQVLQQQSGYLQNRRTSEHSERGDAQLPQVARAAGFETERRRETGDDEVRWETSSQDRGERRGSGGSVRDTERERERILPRSLYPGGQRDPHPRDSGSSASSFGAPASWRAHPAPSAPPADEGDPYGGLDDGIYPSSGSPPSSSSARSSTSTGPLTPASAKVPFVPGQDWKSSSTGLTIDVGHTQDDGESTLQARDWSEVVAKVFTPDTEVSVNTFIPSPSPGETTITSAASTPTPLLNHFSTPYVDDDDEDEETATFIKGFGPARPIAPTSTSTAASPTRVALHDIPSSRSLTSNRSRPTLHVEIKDTPPPVARYRFSSPHTSPLREVSSRSSPDVETSPPEDRRSASRVTGLSRSTRTGELNQLGHSPLARSGSFLERAKHETDWAPRPKVEDVLENLEVFFPKHDLDKNVFDAPATAAVTPSPKTDVAAMIPMRHVGAGGGLTYKKSIKVVARDRKRNMLRASQRVQQQQHDPRMAASVLRRKSTKLFGSRVEEVTPAQMSQMEETIAESAPPDDPSNC